MPWPASALRLCWDIYIYFWGLCLLAASSAVPVPISVHELILCVPCVPPAAPYTYIHNTGMDFYVVLERPGYRVARRRRAHNRVGVQHRVTKEDAMKW